MVALNIDVFIDYLKPLTRQWVNISCGVQRPRIEIDGHSCSVPANFVVCLSYLSGFSVENFAPKMVIQKMIYPDWEEIICVIFTYGHNSDDHVIKPPLRNCAI